MNMRYVIRSCTLVVMALVFFNESTFAKESVYKVVEKRTLMETQPTKSYKSYREWKQSMVEAAQHRLDQFKSTALDQQKTRTTAQGADPNLSHKIAKEQLQVSIANELTISDYFVGYINKQSNLSEVIKNVSGRLSAEEVAELMSAFAYNFNKANENSVKSASDAGFKRLLD